MKRLILAGGGHAHLSVLAAFAAEPEPSLKLTLVTPDRYQYYSGMLPGFMAGHYALEQCRVDLAPLAERAGAELVLQRVVGMEADRHCLHLQDDTHLRYDLLSLDVGSAVHAQGLDALGSTFVPAKPLAAFFARWPQLVAAANNTPDYALAVVGAGAAGLELVLAAAFALRGADSRVHLVGSDRSFLAGHASSVRQRALVCLRDAGVHWHTQRAVSVVLPDQELGGIRLSDGSVLRCNTLLATTGAKALSWLGDSGLAVDTQGFVAVNAQHQSTSHASVFAVGDCCARVDTAVERSGVHAVRAGPVLAHNLRAALHAAPGSRALAAYTPRKRSLYLLACGPEHAIASWGRFSAEGHWVWRWKDHIDRGFVEKFSISEKTKNQG